MKANKSRALQRVLAAGLAAALAATMTPALALAGETRAQETDALEETQVQAEAQDDSESQGASGEIEAQGDIATFGGVTTKDYYTEETRDIRGEGYMPVLYRYYGENRYGTSQAIVEQSERWGYGYGVGEQVGLIIASGASFADALAASGLAGVVDYPILLTNPNYLTQETLAALDYQKHRNLDQPLDIIIVGGPKAVSMNVQNALQSGGYARTLVRLQGENRYETCMKVFEFGDAVRKDDGGGWGNVAVVATGKDFPDALAISPYCAWSNAPIILVGDSLTQSQKEALADMEVVIVGGEKAVSREISQEIAHCCNNLIGRLYGDDRYETAMKIVVFETNRGMTLNRPFFVTGADFPDALAAGQLCAEGNGVMFLIDPSGKKNQPVFDYLEITSRNVKAATIIGGSGAVTRAFEDALCTTILNAWNSGD